MIYSVKYVVLLMYNHHILVMYLTYLCLKTVIVKWGKRELTHSLVFLLLLFFVFFVFCLLLTFCMWGSKCSIRNTKRGGLSISVNCYFLWYLNRSQKVLNSSFMCDLILSDADFVFHIFLHCDICIHHIFPDML